MIRVAAVFDSRSVHLPLRLPLSNVSFPGASVQACHTERDDH